MKGDGPVDPPPIVPGDNDNTIQLIVGGETVYQGAFKVVVETL